MGSFSPKIDWYIRIHYFLAHFMAFSIFLDTLYGENTLYIYVFGTTGFPKAHLWGEAFWDTLYGENTLYISISIYLGLKASQRLSLIKNFFFLRATVMLNVINQKISPISWYFQFFRTPCIVKKDLE